jgi:hypothetical protein
MSEMGTAGHLKGVMDDLCPDGWLIRMDGRNRYLVVTPNRIEPAGRARIQALFWASAILDFREGSPE